MSEAYIPKALREKVSSQARHRCGYCLTSEAVVGTPMEVDHLIPVVWAAEGDRIVGLTPAGRATVVALNLNRPSLVKARQAWVTVGWHPPEDSK